MSKSTCSRQPHRDQVAGIAMSESVANRSRGERRAPSAVSMTFARRREDDIADID
jgi:hypothetical protein